MIKLENISVTFNDGKNKLDAVKNVTLTINRGEVFGIVGLSGAGKSTLVRVINLLQKPSEGRVIIQDKDITKLNSKELRLSLIHI